MCKRSGLICLLLYQAIFLNIVLPAHTRGAITLDGKHSIMSPSCCCCCNAKNGNSDTKEDHSKPAPTPADRANCALCHFAARVIVTPSFDLTLPDVGPLEKLPPPSPLVAVSVDVIPTYRGRAPPVLPI